MRTVYRLIWTSDVGFSGMDDQEYPSLDAAKAAATAGLSWRDWERDEWRSTPDQYGDVFTVRRSYRY